MDRHDNRNKRELIEEIEQLRLEMTRLLVVVTDHGKYRVGVPDAVDADGWRIRQARAGDSMLYCLVPAADGADA